MLKTDIKIHLAIEQKITHLSLIIFPMNQFQQLSVIEISELHVDDLLDYWYGASTEQLKLMGADINKLPPRSDFQEKLLQQIALPYRNKKSYATIWTLNDKAIGHCNIGDINFGNDAYMHLHLWYPDNRLKGMGTKLVQKSIPYFFKNFNLSKLYCQPYSLNPAPNKTLKKIGFTFIKEHECIPGSINFKQSVNLYSLEKASFDKW